MSPSDLDHLSYSSISTYQLCPRSWRFRYLEKPDVPASPNLLFGSAFHDAAESIIETRATSGAPLDVPSLWEHTWQFALEKAEAEGRVAWDSTSPETLAQDGLTMLTSPDAERFFAEFKPLLDHDGKPVIEKRIELGVPGLDIPIIGYIDAIDEAGIPHDFKTSARAWTQQKAEEEAQPTFYLASLNQTGFPLNQSLLFRHVVFTKPSRTGKVQVQTLTTTRTFRDLFRLFGTILDVWKGIVAESFPCNTGSWLCSAKWCSYWHLCVGKV